MIKGRTVLNCICSGLLIAYCMLLLTSCGNTKRITKSTEVNALSERDTKTKVLLKEALKYKNTAYKMGGTDSHGMDCSGLVYTSFKKIAVDLPRTSREQSSVGEEVSKSEAAVGDLLFFETSGKAKGINHVGLITKISNDGQVTFIHSTLKAGVIEDTLDMPYYQKSFVKIMRVY
ncbi:MAG TPA: C40 family peptidase [Bacteroidia bacterium]|nr:C40 family peptidase [Bacteroidia bacterium]HRH09110.1 C40 family peptidase [Bacteroidia bacterium]